MNVVVVIAVVIVALIVVVLSVRVVTQYEKGVLFRLGRAELKRSAASADIPVLIFSAGACLTWGARSRTAA